MSMALTPNDLIEIADKVKKINELGVEVTQIIHKGHYVWLKKVVGGEAEGHHIIGISLDKQGHHQHGTVLRGGN